MHPAVCRFISDAVFEGRLEAEKGNEERVLVLGQGAHPALKPAGIAFVGLEHDGCSQRSEEEAREVLSIYESLLGQTYSDKDGEKQRVRADNIMLVAPYNAQVNLLRAKLPKGALVGKH